MAKKRQFDPWRRKQKGLSKKFFFAAFIVCVTSVVFFREAVVCSALHAYVRFVLPKSTEKSFSCETCTRQGKHLILEGVTWKQPDGIFTADQVTVSCSIDMSPLCFKPQVAIVHPELQALDESFFLQKSSFSSLLVPSKFHEIQLDVQNGVLQFTPTFAPSRFYFSFKSGEEKGEIGTLLLSQDPSSTEDALLQVVLTAAKEEVGALFQIEGCDVAYLAPLVSCISPALSKGWHELQGQLQVRGEVFFDHSLSLKKLFCETDLCHLILVNPTRGFFCQADAFRGHFSYPSSSVELDATDEQQIPFWKKAEAHFTVAEGQIAFSAPGYEWGCREIKGELSLFPHADPSLQMQGEIFSKDFVRNFAVEGKGIIHEDGTFWLQSDIAFTKQDAVEDKTPIFISLCRSENQAFTLQADFTHVSSELVELGCHMCKRTGFSLSKGHVDGSIVARFEQMQPIHIEWSHFSGQDVCARVQNKTFCAKDFSSSGVLDATDQQWSVTDLHVALQKGGVLIEGSSEIIAECSGEVHIKDNLFTPSNIEASWTGGKAMLTFLGPESEYFLQGEVQTSWSHLLSFLPVSLSVPVKDAPTALSFNVKKKQRSLAIEGSSHFAIDKERTEVLDFGWELTKDFSQDLFDLFTAYTLSEHSGWLRTEKISSSVYGPILALFTPSVTCQGDMDLFGLFNEKRAEISVQSAELILAHPSFTLQTGPLGEKDESLLKTEGRAQFLYEFEKGSFQGILPLKEAYFQEKQSGIALEKLQGTLSFTETVIESPKLEARYCDILVPFKLYIDGEGIFIETEEVKGRLENVAQILPELTKGSVKHLPVTGDFVIPKQGGALFLQKSADSWHGRVNAFVTKGTWALTDASLLKEVSLELGYDSAEGILSVKNAGGHCCLKEALYSFTLGDFCFDTAAREHPFDLRFMESSQECAHFIGHIQKDERITLAFDPEKTHIFSMPLQLSGVSLDPDFSLSELGLFSVFEVEKAKSSIKLFQDMGLLSSTINAEAEKLLEGLQGKIETTLSYKKEPHSFHVDLQSNTLKWKGNLVSNFALKAHKQGEQWIIERLQWSPFTIQACLAPKKDHIACPYFKIIGEQGQIEAEGAYYWDKKELQITRSAFCLDLLKLQQQLPMDVKNSPLQGQVQGKASLTAIVGDQIKAGGQLQFRSSITAPAAFDMASRQIIFFSFDSEGAITINGLSLVFLESKTDEVIGQLLAGSLHYLPSSQTFSLPKYDLSISPRGTDKLVGISWMPKWLGTLRKDKQWGAEGDFAFSKEGFEVSCFIKDGTYSFNDKELELKQIRLQVHPTSLYLKCSAAVQKQPLWVDLQTEFAPQASLYVQVKEPHGQEGLRFMFTRPARDFQCERIEGKLLGMEVNVKQDLQKKTEATSVYFGSAKVDFLKLRSLLPPDLAKPIQSLGMGPGYEMEGQFFLHKNKANPFRFVGTIKGEAVGLLGYSFEAMQLQADLSLENSVLQDIKMEDAAGSLSMKLCKISKEEGGEKWDLFAPLVHVKEFRPSMLAKIGKNDRVQKPFVIRNLSVYDVNGVLGDAKSFTGSGLLNFANAYKKEYSVLDIPFSLIKDLGLDPGLLTPIAGEVDFKIKEGKCLLTDLRNSYSEGKRSEFFLSYDQASPYLDFDGQWHVDLKMKQHVLLKWTESLVLTIRGKLSNPKYSLKNVDSAL